MGQLMNVSWAPFQDILCTCQLCSVTIQQKQHMSPVVISLTCLGFFFIRKIWAQMGGQDKPSLSAWPSPVVPQGQHVTLPCRSHHKFDTFRLYKDNGILISKLHGAISQKGFLVGPVTPTHAGTYRCCGSYPGSSSVWSAPSDPLVIVVTGLHQKPSLGAQPGAVVRSGENVTFSCCSESSFDVYHLSRDEQPRERWLAKGQRRGGESQADFPLGPAHSALGGTYRCHGSFNRSPCEWSGPSDPLYLSITGNSSTSCLPSTKPTCETGNPRHLHVLAGPLVAIVFLAVLLFFLTRRWCPAKENVATMNREPEVDRMDPQAEDPPEVIYTQLDHCISMRKKPLPLLRGLRNPCVMTVCTRNLQHAESNQGMSPMPQARTGRP